MRYQVAGAGDSAFNGIYTYTSDVNGHPAYQLDGTHQLYWYLLLNAWVLGAGASPGYTGPATDSPVGAWTTGLSAPPAPQVAEYPEIPENVKGAALALF